MRILVIEDEYVALTKMMAMLSEFGRCDAATNGKQAFEMYSEAIMQGDPYQLISVDIHIPDWDGLDLLRRFRKSEESAGLPAARKIVVSAMGQLEMVKQAAHHRCDAFLVKPVARHVLFKKLDELGIQPKSKR